MKRAWIAPLLLTLTASLVSAPAGAVAIKALVAHPTIDDVEISPDGKHLAFRGFRNGKHYLSFVDRKTLKVIGGFGFHGRNDVGEYSWANDERIVGSTLAFASGDIAPSLYDGLFAVNLDGSKSEPIFGFSSGEMQTGHLIRPRNEEHAWGEIVDLLPDDPNNIIIAATPWSISRDKPTTAELLNIYTGVPGKRLAKSRFSYGTFFVDQEGTVRLIASMSKDNVVHLQSLPKNSSTWIDLPWHPDEYARLAWTDAGDAFYVLDNFGADKIGLWVLSLDGKHRKTVYENDHVDVTDALLSSHGRSVVAVRLDDGYPRYLIYSKRLEGKVFKELLETFAGNMVSIFSRTRDGRFWTIVTSTDTNPGALYLFDVQKKQVILLYRVYDSVNPASLAPMKPITFNSFDGTQVSGYFTAAKGAKLPNAPLVVLVHGGPAARDYWGFDGQVQVLATRGYSVLQVNYRGSTGYGKQFREASRHHWGDDVQKDIIAGTRWALTQGYGRRGHVYIVGESFGAYSAVQSATLEPDLYRCVVAGSGVYDLAMMYKIGDVARLYGGVGYLKQEIGEDKTELARFSPVNNVGKLKAPVFIAHGTRDQRAPIRQAEELRRALKRHHKPYVWFVKRGEAHGFYSTQDRVDYLTAVLDFLGKCESAPMGK